MVRADAETIAFSGGNNVVQVGPERDVLGFFACLERFAADALGPADRDLLLDRFYKRYLSLEELPLARAAMQSVQHHFAQIESKDLNWSSFGIDADDTDLQLGGRTLGDVFAKYFIAFNKVVDSALRGHEIFGFFKPAKIGRSDLANLYRDEKRPREVYDQLEGPPLWLSEAAKARLGH